jgi:hypothetical protein
LSSITDMPMRWATSGIAEHLCCGLEQVDLRLEAEPGGLVAELLLLRRETAVLEHRGGCGSSRLLLDVRQDQPRAQAAGLARIRALRLKHGSLVGPSLRSLERAPVRGRRDSSFRDRPTLRITGCEAHTTHRDRRRPRLGGTVGPPRERPIAAVALAALLAGALVIPIDGGFARLSDLAPFDRIPIESGWWTLGAPLAILLVCRAVAVGIAAAGWVVFPLEYRARLAAIALREEAGHPVP